MEISHEDHEALRELETNLWRAEIRYDPKRMEVIFAPDFLEVGSSGKVHTREACIHATRNAINAQLPLPDFRIRLISPEIAQVTYNSAVTVDGHMLNARRSSIWSRESGQWALRFHQGTPFKESQPDISRNDQVSSEGNPRHPARGSILVKDKAFILSAVISMAVSGLWMLGCSVASHYEREDLLEGLLGGYALLVLISALGSCKIFKARRWQAACGSFMASALFVSIVAALVAWHRRFAG